MKINADPMDASPPGMTTCGARIRSGGACARARVQGRSRCHYHGGAAGSGGPSGSRNGAYTKGERTKTAVAERRWARSLIRLLISQ